MKLANVATVALLASVALAACEAKKRETPAESAPAKPGESSLNESPKPASPAASESPKPAAPAASESPKPAALESTLPVKPEKEPERIQVQHILIAFQGSGTRATRPKAEAEKLAKEVLDRARAGEDFDALVKKYTDDSPPGIYAMANNGVAPDRTKQEYARGGMVPAFGNVGFAISVGNIDMAPWDPQASPYGWHIIKRLK